MSVTFTIPELETERLRLRAPRAEDLDAEYAFYRTERSKGVGGPLSEGRAFRGFASIIGHWVLRGFGFWAVEEKASGSYCGRVGLWYPRDWPEAELGWTLMGHAEGRGIAREAALASRDYAYGTLGWNRIISLIAPDNSRSQALAATLGAVHERDFDHETYGRMEIWTHPSATDLKTAKGLN